MERPQAMKDRHRNSLKKIRRYKGVALILIIGKHAAIPYIASYLKTMIGLV